jgi:gliding motility-associated-like protein
VRVTLSGGLLGALSTIYLYDAFYTTPGPPICNTTYDELHGISSALLGLGLNVGGVVNPQNAIDGNINTASTLNAGVGALGAFAQQTLIFQSASTIGDSVRLTLTLPKALLDVGLLSGTFISTFNGNTDNNDTQVLNGSLLRLRLLDLSNNRQRLTITYVPTKVFDRVQLRLGGIASVLSTLDLNEAEILIPQPIITVNNVAVTTAQLCAGSTITLNATANAPGTTFNWYTQPTGGTAVFTGASFQTPALTNSITYYVTATRAGCATTSGRAQVTVGVNQIPAAPVITNANINVCPNSPGVFAATPVTGVTINWYAAATGGTPLFSGNTYTSPALAATTSYYAEAVAGGTCVSTTRTKVTATISPLPAAPTLTSPNVTICDGDVAVFDIASPVVGQTYNWYAAATGGVPLRTGTNFASPALNANTTYYVEAVNAAGCVSGTRTPANVTVQPKPAAPILAVNNSTIVAGQTATINVTNAQTGITYNWYASTASTTPIHTGNSFLTPALFSTTTYYVAAVNTGNSANCESVTRTPITITVTINNNSPCTFANQQSSVVNGLCVACGVTNDALAADADTTTASTINVPVGLLGGSVSQTLTFPNPGFAGDTIKLALETPGGLADLNLLGGINVAVYNGGTLVGSYPLNNSLLTLRLLSGTGKYAAYIPAVGSYDHIVVTLSSGAATLLTSLKIYYAVQQYPTPKFNPTAPEICKGSPVTLTITSPTPANGTFSWFTTPTGGTAVHTGTSYPIASLTANTTYYVEYSRNGSCISPTRAPIQVIVNDAPVKPVVTPPNAAILAGQTATFKATVVNGATINWYTTATGGTPVFTGSTFQTPALSANTTYYAEASLGSCVSPDRTVVPVTVTPIVIPDVSVTPPTQSVNIGTTGTITASSTTPGTVFNWYTTPAGGTPIFTGKTFVTPAVFANTTYYAEAVVTATGAKSATRAPAQVNIIAVGTDPVACAAATAQTNSANGLCLFCSVANPGGAIDNDRNTFSQIHVPIGLLGGSAQQTLQFAHAGIVGDSVIVELGIPGSLADVGVLSQIQIGTYNGGTFNNDFFTINGSLLNVTLLNGTSRFRVAFKAGAAFDRVEVQFNSGVAGLLNAVNVYDAYQSVAAPIININNVTTCSGTGATLTVNNPPANVTIKWYTAATGGTAVFTGAVFPTPALSATTTYYAEASRTVDGCAQSKRTPATVTITPAPVAPIVDALAKDVCSGQPATFTAQAVNGITYTWYAAATGGTPLFTGAQFVSPPLTVPTTSYYVQANAGSCGSSVRTKVTANVIPTPSVPVVPTTPAQVCSGSSAVLTATAQPGVTLNWYTTATGGTPVGTGSPFTTPALTASTSYYVEAASTGGCTSSTRAKADVSVNPTPVAPTIAVNPAGGQITSGQTATLTASSTTPGVTYKWYASATGGTPVSTVNPFTTPALTSNATYYVEATTAAGCTSATRTSVNIIVNPVFSTSCDFASTQTFDVNGGLLCVGCAVNFPNNSVDQDTTNFSQLSVPIGLVGSNVSQKLIFSDAGVVGDTVTVKISVPASLATVGVLNQLQIASYNGATYNNDRITLSSNLLKITLLAGNQTALVKFAPHSAFDRVELRYNGALASLFNTLNIYYATKQVETPTLDAKSVSICAGNTATFTVNNVRAGITYKWYTSATGGSPVFTGAVFHSPALNLTTTYYVESSRASSGCANPNRVAATANVTPAPVNPVLAQISVPVCSGSGATLTVSPTQAGVVYNWYATATGGAPIFTGAQFPTPALTVNTSYYVEAASNGCVSPARTKADVVVNPLPVAPTVTVNPAGGQVTAGSTATLTAVSTTPGAIFKWYTTATGGTAVFTGFQFITPPLTATTTYYAESSLVSGCVSPQRTPVILTVTQPVIIPNVAVNPPTQTVNVGTSGSLTASSTTPGTIVFNWFTTPTGGTSIFTGANFVTPAVFTQTTYYAEASIPATGAVSATRASGVVNVNAIGPNPVPCDAAIDQTSSVSGICLICGVSNDGGSVDNNSETFSQIHVPVGLLGGSAQQTLRFANTGIVGDSVTVDLGIPGSLLDVGLLSQIQVATYNGSTYNGDRVTVDGSLLKITLLNGTSRFKYKFVAAHTFDRVQITFNSGVAGLLAAVNVYDAYQSVAAPTISAPNVTTCSGTQATLVATASSNATIKWYTSKTGGNPIFTGATFPTPVLTATTTYYAEASRTSDGCAQAVRTPATVTITPAPAKPVVPQLIVTVCSGQPATFTVQTVAGVTYNWYTAPTGGTPIFTGAIFNTPILTAPTNNYYVEATAGSCGSSTRTQVTANVTATPVVPVISQTPVSTCSGTSATLEVTSPVQGYTYNWYATATGGAPVGTGPVFHTPTLSANTSYYVEASLGSCTSSTRAKADVIVNPTPVTPVVTSNAPGGQITSGQTATLTVSPTTPGITYKWYTSSTGGTAIFTGPIFNTPALTSTTTYYVEAVAASGCTSTTRTPVTVKVNPIFSTSCDFASTQTFDVNGGLICIACGVTDENNSVDQDTTNFSQLHLPISVLGSYVSQKLIFADPGIVGDTVTLKISVPGSLADVNILGSIQLASYNGSTFNNDRITLSSNLLKIAILPGGQTAIIKFAPKAVFDRVEVRLNSGIATLLTTTNIYYASKQVEAPRLATNTIPICAGGSATFTVINPRAGVTYRWYTAAVGGTLVHTGVTFPVSNVTATTTYYVESSHTSTLCPNPNRVGATVNVTPSPVNPILASYPAQICAGQPVTLAVTNANGATINWYTTPTGGTPAFSGVSINVTPISDITYYAEAVNGTSCTSPARTPAPIKVNPLPSKPGVASPNVAVCLGSSTILAVASPEAGVTYNWYTTLTGGATVHTGPTFPTPAITQAITYYIEATSASGCGNAGGRTAVTVTPDALPVAPALSAAQNPICNGGTATINVTNPVAGIQYNWYSAITGGTLVHTGLDFTTPSLTGTTSYFVEAVNANGTTNCSSTTRTEIKITVLPIPPAPIVSTPAGGAVCVGTSATLTITNPQAGLIYNWYTVATGGTPVFTSLSTIYNTPPLTTDITYYVEATSPGNCNPSTRTGVPIKVNPLPNAPVLVGTGDQVCLGSPTTLTVQAQAGVTYNWYTVPTGGTPVFTGNPYPTPAITATTDFYVEAINSNGCGNAGGRTKIEVTIIAAPSAPVISNTSTTSICTGAFATLIISNPQPLLTYKWYTTATGGTPIASGSPYHTPVLTADATYYVEAVTSNGCTSSTRTPVPVTVNPLPGSPTVTAAGGKFAICSGSSAILTASAPGTIIAYNWYNVATGGTPVYIGSTFPTPPVTAAITYYVEAVSNTGCASNVRTPVPLTIDNTKAPDPTVDQNSQTTCQNSSANVKIANPVPGTTYTWYTSASGGTSVFTGPIYTTPVLTANTTFYVEATNAQACNASTRIAVPVTVTPQPPTPTVVGADPHEVCSGSQATLSVNSPQAGITYNWYTDAGRTNLVFTGPNFPLGAVNANAIYYVEAASGTCSSPGTATVHVTAVPAPGAPVVANAGSINSCAGGSVTLTIDNPQPGLTYSWYSTATGGTALRTGTSFPTPVLTSTTIYFAEAVNATGCPSASRTPVTVNVTSAPIAPQASTQGTSICPGTNTTISATSATPGAIIRWYADNTGGAALFTGTNFTTPVLSANTTYYAEAEVTGGCVSTTRTPVTVTILGPLAAPVVTVGSTTTESITFTWAAVTGATGYEVSLDNGQHFVAPSTGTTGLSHTITGLQPGASATIIVRATGNTTCQLSANSAAVTGTTSNPFGNGLFIPNAFTPNGDGNNDILYVYGTAIKTLTLSIYDQWGELQFKSTNKSSGWDGTYKGTKQPVGVYVYYVEATLNDGQLIKRKGTVTLLR